ncbi:hypothetical protein BJY59DRAFT_685279 [Rhodotorula toruloides]
MPPEPERGCRRLRRSGCWLRRRRCRCLLPLRPARPHLARLPPELRWCRCRLWRWIRRRIRRTRLRRQDVLLVRRCRPPLARVRQPLQVLQLRTAGTHLARLHPAPRPEVVLQLRRDRPHLARLPHRRRRRSLRLSASPSFLSALESTSRKTAFTIPPSTCRPTLSPVLSPLYDTRRRRLLGLSPKRDGVRWDTE